MAKYTINYACGHTEERQLFGPHKQRYYIIEQAEKGLCDACLAQEIEADYPELPALTGSEKQVSWGQKERALKLQKISETFEKIQEITEKTLADHPEKQDEIMQMSQKITAALTEYRNRPAAKDWIDGRSDQIDFMFARRLANK